MLHTRQEEDILGSENGITQGIVGKNLVYGVGDGREGSTDLRHFWNRGVLGILGNKIGGQATLGNT